MKRLYVDTATTTGGWNWKDGDQAANQPHMIRIAALLVDGDTMVDEFCRLIRPLPGWPGITPDGLRRHGIEDGDLNFHGVVLGAVTARIGSLLAKTDRVVAHSAAFHRKVLTRAYRDAHLPPPELPPMDCTMTRSADIVQVVLQGNGRWKWPTMAESFVYFAKEGLSLPADPIDRGLTIVRAVWLIERGIQDTLHPPQAA